MTDWQGYEAQITWNARLEGGELDGAEAELHRPPSPPPLIYAFACDGERCKLVRALLDLEPDCDPDELATRLGCPDHSGHWYFGRTLIDRLRMPPTTYLYDRLVNGVHVYSLPELPTPTPTPGDPVRRRHPVPA